MIRFLTNKWVHITLLLFLLIAAVIYSGSNSEFRQRLQYLTFDSFNKLYPREATNQIAIIDIDEKSLSELGQWPWPKTTIATLVESLNKNGAKVIAFDMVFAEADRTSPDMVSDRLPNDPQYIDIKNSLEKLPNHDDVFSQAIAKANNVVTGFAAAGAEETNRLPFQKMKPTFLMRDKDIIKDNALTLDGYLTNLPKLSSVAAGNGSFIATPHFDGIIREVALFNSYNGVNNKNYLYPMLGLEALRVSVSKNARYIIKQQKDRGSFDANYQVKVGSYEIPMEKDSRMWVHYRDIDEDEYISAYKVLSDDYAEEVQQKLKDKIVFVGTSAEGLRDIRSSPLDIFIPGVEVHVNMVEQVIQGKYLQRPDTIVGVEVALIAFTGFLIIILAPFINAVWLGLLSFTVIGGIFFGSWNAYLTKGLLIDPVYPSAVIFLLFLVSSLFSYVRSEMDRRQVKTAFGHYISPDFMEELTKSPDKLKLGGEVRELTVMFTDIRGFTKISEKLSPEDLIQLMNDFLTPMSNLVMESRGTIDKYMGDAMMAFWNAPLDDPDHAYQACLTALKMNEALVPVNNLIKQRAEEEGIEPLLLNAGIGINTGPCSVGNMGSKQRFAYSALGDAVNLASRLEGQTKSYGVSTLVGEDTREMVPELAMLELDLIRVIGREQPVRVYTLVGDKDYSQTKNFLGWEKAHKEMLKAYRDIDMTKALEKSKKASKLANEEMKTYYKIYELRMSEFTKNPPPKNWDGVFIAKTK